MIYPSFISTVSLSSETRSSISRVQARLVEAQQELTTGRHADVGLTLGAKTGMSVNLRQEKHQVETLRETNSLVSTRLVASQTSLQSISDLTQNYLATVVRGQASSANAETLVVSARTSLSALNDGVNASVDGQYLFAGINSDVRPMQDYFATPTSTARQSVANAFVAKFGFAQDATGASSITYGQMKDFIDNEFAALFQDPGWTTNWSAASDRNVRSRISRQELVDTSTNANEQVFRDVTASMVMIADLGFESLNDNARQAILDKAVQQSGKSVGGVADLQSSLGVTQERVSNASGVLDLQVRHVTRMIDELESVDPNEVAMRITTLMTQLESSYAITKKIHDLSILQYL